MGVNKNDGTYFETIMNMPGFEGFKESIRQLRLRKTNAERLGNSKYSLPDFLWISRSGGNDLLKLLKLLSGFLNEEKMYEFRGNEKFLEFELNYTAPDEPFRGLDILHGTLKNAAGHRSVFRGILCVGINAWLGHMTESHFELFLEYIDSHRGKLLTIFCVQCDAESSSLNKAESFFPARIVEMVSIGSRGSEEWAEFICVEYMKPRGFITESDGAKKCLAESVNRLAQAGCCNDRSINMLADGIVNNLLASEECTNQITADVLTKFGKILEIESLVKTRIKNKRTLGFTREAITR